MKKKNICKLKIFIERRFFEETKKKIINGNTLYEVTKNMSIDKWRRFMNNINMRN